MYKLIQKNKKKMLAIFGAMLMVVFILPPQLGGQTDQPVGTIGEDDETVYSRQMQDAVAEWQFLLRNLDPRDLVTILDIPLLLEIRDREELYFLLQKEADREGIRVSPEQVEDFLQTRLSLPATVSGPQRQQYRQVVGNLLRIKALQDRVAGAVKISEPMLRNALATEMQDLRLNIVELSADELKNDVPAPTDQELQAHFKRYANVAPGDAATAAAATATAPSTGASTRPGGSTGLGFGYRFPDRVKLQYLTIPREQVKQVVRKSRKAYDWEVEARQYYIRHLDEFPYVEPASKPATTEASPAAPAADPATEPKPEPQPQTPPGDAPPPATPTPAPDAPKPQPEGAKPEGEPKADESKPEAPGNPAPPADQPAPPPAEPPKEQPQPTPPPAPPQVRSDDNQGFGPVRLAAFAQDAAPPATGPEAAAPAADATPPATPNPEAQPEADGAKPAPAEPAPAQPAPEQPKPAAGQPEAKPQEPTPAEAKPEPAGKTPDPKPADPAAPPATKPEHQPFEDVKEQILDKVMAPAIDRKTAEIRNAINQRLTADYQAWKARPAKPPAQPAAAATYGSFEYLQQLAADIEKQYGVRITAVNNPKGEKSAELWTAVDELSELPGIGNATATAAGQTGLEDIVRASVPFAGEAADAKALQLYQFSEPLRDDDAVYFFRLTAAEKAHAPASLAEVKDQVANDLRLARAYERARETANSLLKSAREQGLPAAAAAQKQKLITTGAFDRTYETGQFIQQFNMTLPGPPIPNYPVEGDAKKKIIDTAYDLLAKATPKNLHPRTIVEFPGDKKVAVVELGRVTNKLDQSLTNMARVRLQAQLRRTRSMDLIAKWFDYDAVKARLNWRPIQEEDRTEDKENPATASRPGQA